MAFRLKILLDIIKKVNEEIDEYHIKDDHK
jgi:hypothetical protein